MKEDWMNKDWWRFRRARSDITDWVIHWVKEKSEDGKSIPPIPILLEILECGYLKPTFAIMQPVIYDATPRPTIRGPHPAVCFTEQTLECFLASCEFPFQKKRYWPYGIALHKWALYRYGGRPVIYGDQSILGIRPLASNESGFEKGKEVYVGGLREEHQYLWVRYAPIPSPEGYPVDWTHEREWRAKVRTYHHRLEGDLPEEGVPIVLPPTYVARKWVGYSPKLLVQAKQEKELLTKTIETYWSDWKRKCENEYLKKQFDHYPGIRIIALEEVEEHLEKGNRRWARLDTLPQ